MTTIPMLGIRLFDPEHTTHFLKQRFMTHLETLRTRSKSASLDAPEDLPVRSFRFGDLSEADIDKIDRRVERIIKARAALREVGHLKEEDRRPLHRLAKGAELIAIPSEHRADEIAAELHADMPWMGPTNEMVWHAMRRSVREGWPGLRLPPMLLNGPPGIGKSHWARRLGELLSTPVLLVDAGGESASFGLIGTQRGWGSAEPGRLVRTVLRTAVANPIVVVDEIEKAGTPTSLKGQAFGLTEGLLPLLEPLSAKRWSCPYFQVPFDMSWIGWILTSNNASILSEPFRSRCPPIQLRHLMPDELTAFVRREGMKRELSETAIEAIAEVLTHPSLRQHRPSLRIANRMLQRAADLESGPLLH